MGKVIGIEFRLPARIRKKGKWYVSSCASLDVHSQGLTKQQARRNLIDALVFFLESCFERGTLAEVLREAGFIPTAGLPTGRVRRLKDDELVTVPLPFMIRERRSSAHGA
jgi:predicted RNase H-like HicB family nuclease